MAGIGNLEVVYRSPHDLRCNPRNARTHSDKQVVQIGASIEEFGFTNPILIDETGEIIAGHGRLAAARALNMTSVPCIVLAGLTSLQKRALMLADNKLAMNADWDPELLAEELSQLSLPDLPFDIGVTGFETPEIDSLLSAQEPQRADPLDMIAAIDRSLPAVSKLGDRWMLGKHVLLCGSALDPVAYDELMDGVTADQVITDPPYNVPIEGHVTTKGSTKHPEFAMASGEMSSGEFTAFLQQAFSLLAKHSNPGSLGMVFMDWRHMTEILSAAQSTFASQVALCVWDKINGGMGSLYRSQHELVFVFKIRDGRHVNNIELGRHGRYRTNVWRYAGASMFRRGRKADLETHPTVKPAAMIIDVIKDASHRNGIILDPFGGSGTTILAAERTGRQARLIEIDPYYVDASVRRWQKLTGSAAVNSASGATFDELATRKAQPVEATPDGR